MDHSASYGPTGACWAPWGPYGRSAAGVGVLVFAGSASSGWSTAAGRLARLGVGVLGSGLRSAVGPVRVMLNT